MKDTRHTEGLAATMAPGAAAEATEADSVVEPSTSKTDDWGDAVPREVYEAALSRAEAAEMDLAIIAAVVGPQSPNLRNGSSVRAQ